MKRSSPVGLSLKISVVIPTRERAPVLEKALATVTAQRYENLEVIVSDNCSTDTTRDVVRECRDSRVRYVRTGERFSMSANWEFALSHVTGDWVTILGDDDGLLPGALDRVVEIAQQHASQRAIISPACRYFWPSEAHPYGQLDVSLKDGIELRDAREWRAKVMRGEANYTALPMLYSGGFVHASLIEKLKPDGGKVYRSCIPDIYSALAISSVVETYVFVQQPLAIAGLSTYSTGSSFFSGKNKNPAQRFYTEGNIPFHPMLAAGDHGEYPKSIQALVYESYLQSHFLRTPSSEVTEAQQLEVALASVNDSDAAQLEQWARRFAAHHNLDLANVRSRTARRRLVLRLHGFSSQVSRAFYRYRLGTKQHPIPDVLVASKVAASVHSTPPSSRERSADLLRRLVAKYSVLAEPYLRHGRG